jgi:hypothetical protein
MQHFLLAMYVHTSSFAVCVSTSKYYNFKWFWMWNQSLCQSKTVQDDSTLVTQLVKSDKLNMT